MESSAPSDPTGRQEGHRTIPPDHAVTFSRLLASLVMSRYARSVVSTMSCGSRNEITADVPSRTVFNPRSSAART